MSWEVRTMSSARSYFNVALYRKNLTRFWPVWVLYTIIWFFVLPVNLILQGSMDYYSGYDQAAVFADRTVLQLLPELGLYMAVALSILTAMAIWSYLYNNRSAGLIHALPIRREGLFFTGFLAGVTFFIVPNAVIFLLTLGAEALAGTVNLGALALWFAVQSMLCLFFFCFATLCAFVTGHILALPVFFTIFNFLAVGILALAEGVLHNFVYGFGGLTAAWPAVERLSPLFCMEKVLKASYVREGGVITGVTLQGVPTLIVYTAVGLALAALALFFYRRHQVEQAGEVVTAVWLRPVFKYGVAFCGALTFGSLFYAIFSDIMGKSAWGMLGFLLLWGFLSYLAAEMLLQKSFRVLKRSWKGCVVFLIVLVVLTAVMELDLTGYERRVPAAAEVESVTLKNVDSAPYDSGRNAAIDASDADLIARILSLHASTAHNKGAVEGGLRDYYRCGPYAAADDGMAIPDRDIVSFKLSYILKNGREIFRSYSVPVTAELLADPASPAALLLDILNHRQDVADDYFPAGIAAADFIAGTVSFYDKNTRNYSEMQLTAAQVGKVYEAAVEDMASGGLGRRYLLKDRDYLTQVYMNEITLTFYGMFPGWTVGTEPDTERTCFYLQTDSVNLIATLQGIGVLDNGRTLVTQMEQRMLEKGDYKG